MHDPMLELLFSEYRRKVLSLLFIEAGQAFHVREIARRTATQAGTLHKELSRLAEGGILLRKRQGNQICYQANADCLIFPELAAIFRKTCGPAARLRQVLAGFGEDIERAFIFGSVASGKATAASDIDVLIVGKLSFADVIQAVYPLQATLGREINPKLYSPEEWRAALAENSAFIQDIMQKPQLWIAGDKDDAGQSGRAGTGGDNA
ncbi:MULTISPECIES: nucleotidyltransferase domain-containing protein [Serratia]|uniref:nucleotidyltransferase domain-containing protein n=1 Tax=Serratia TaxID=613 RepID=UPI0021784C20|nr:MULTISPECIES: nucleotidyltransferase domain-containing protein [Serratia]MDI6931829.1 nucleotidyltransferase domain-containing protein [Serratia sp. Se-PFBMAAmG]MDI6945786.1 nucleotidyltransferase domain-containing protein [Serratia sp. Se-RSmG]MDI6975258.1 nucleotidyltransferase domain-containing protein [Serratia sp. Se-RSBMAAmG]MDI9265004.1 nucleotidyltransferase domain-containing protein [Serratia sp. PF2-63]MDI9268779.1 nucleotidyltransferase domain-containing protein [Serratia sp. PF-